MDEIALRVAQRFVMTSERFTTEQIASWIDTTRDKLEDAFYVQSKTGNWWRNVTGRPERPGAPGRWYNFHATPAESGTLHAKATRVGSGLVVFKGAKPRRRL